MRVISAGIMAIAAIVATAAPAAAQVADTPAADAAAQQAPVQLFDGEAVGEDTLAAADGREGTPTWVSANSSSNATVTGNSVGANSQTGDLNVADNAFQNVSGVSMVNLNTGNSSAINASMNVNIILNTVPPAASPGGM